MAGERNAVEAVVRTRYEAGALDNFGRDLRATTQSLRVFGGAIASEINPVLGQLLQAMTQASQQTRSFGLGIAALGIGTAAAAVGLGQLIQQFNEGARRSAEFRLAVESLNFGAVKGQIDAASASLEAFDRSFFGLILNATRTEGALNLLDKMFGRDALQNFLDTAREGFARVLPVEQIRRQNEEYLKQQQTLEQLARLEGERYSSQGQLESFAATQERIEQSISNQFVAREKLARLEAAARESAAQGRYGGPQPGEINEIRNDLDRQLTTLQRQFGLSIDTSRERGRQTRLDIAERRGLEAAAQAGPQETYPEGFGSDAFNYAARLERARELNSLEQQRLAIQTEQYGLSQSQIAALQLQTIENEKQRKILEAQGNLTKEQIADDEARVRSLAVMRQELERTSGLAGLKRGFEDVAESFESTGLVMQNLARQTSSSMQQSFGDFFFYAITNFKNLSEVGKQAGLSLLRNFTDALATQTTAPLVRGLANLLPSFGGGSTPFTGSVPIAPGSQELLARLQAQGFEVVPGPGGPVVAMRGGGAYGLLPASSDPFAAVNAFDTIGASTNVGLSTGPSLGSRLLDAGSSLLMAAPLLGLSLGAAYATGSFQTALTGAIFGYTAGSFIGSAAGTLGGAALGGISGAALGAAGGLLGAVLGMVASVPISEAKNPRNMTNRGERFVELQHVVTADAARIQAARTFPELAAAIRESLHEAFGGPGGRGRGTATAGFAASVAGVSIILPGGSYPATMTLEELATMLRSAGETFTAQLQLGIPERDRRDMSQAFTDLVRAQVDIIRKFDTLPVAFLEQAPGIGVATILPLGAIESIPIGSQNVGFSRRLAASEGLSEGLIDLLITRIRERNSQTDVVPDLTEQLFLRK